MVAGVYRFQFAVIDSAGLTGVDTSSITVSPDLRPIKTLTSQPTNNTTESNLYLLGTFAYGDPVSPELSPGTWTNGGESFLIRSVLKFDLSIIPANATILSAKLSLYSNPTPLNGDHTNANSGTANSIYIERNTAAWNSTVTWATQPSSDATTQIAISQTNLSLFDLVDIDVKNLVTTMVSTINYGFKLRLQNETAFNIRNFCSSKHADAGKHPKLVITYQ
jgi:hypothetical protein